MRTAETTTHVQSISACRFAWRVRVHVRVRPPRAVSALCLLRNVCLYSDDGVCGVWCPCYNSISRAVERADRERGERAERERRLSLSLCARPAGLKNNTAALKMCVIV